VRAEVSRQLLQDVQSELARRLPGFARVRSREAPGGRLFECPMRGSWAYVWVSPRRPLDTFAVEIAWTAKRGYPRFYTPFPERASRPPYGRFRPRKGYAKFTLGELWDEPNQLERWSIGGSPAVDLRNPLAPPRPVSSLTAAIRRKAREVVEMLAKHAVPYFERRTAAAQRRRR
jgi:hypothetical protein